VVIAQYNMIGSSLKINLSDFFSGQDQKDFQINGNLADFDDEIKVKNPVKVELKLNRADDKILAAGKMKAEVISLCSRCGKKFSKKKEFDFDSVFSKNPDPESDEWKVDEAGNIDLTDLLIQEIIVNMPVKNLCNSKCKGAKNGAA